jgi:hypothetical protein
MLDQATPASSASEPQTDRQAQAVRRAQHGLDQLSLNVWSQR